MFYTHSNSKYLKNPFTERGIFLFLRGSALNSICGFLINSDFYNWFRYRQAPRKGAATPPCAARTRAKGRSVTLFILCAPLLSLASVPVTEAQSSPASERKKANTGKPLPAVVKVGGYPLIAEADDSTRSILEVDSSALNRTGSDSPETQIAAIANLNWAGGTSRPRFLQIRGVGELEQYKGAPNSTVTVLLDGVDLTGMSAGLMLFDIDRLQVFRGSQPLGFGPNGYAGIMALSTPSLDRGAATNHGTLSFGNGDTVTAGLAFGDSFARADTDVGYRITLYRNQQNGFRFNDYYQSSSTNARSETSGRAKLTVSRSANDSVTLMVQDVYLDNKYDAFSPENGLRTHSDRPGRDAERLKLISVRSDSSLSKHADLTTLSSYYTYDLDYSYDGDWGNAQYWGENAPYDYFSQTGRARNVFAQLIQLSSPTRCQHMTSKGGILEYTTNHLTNKGVLMNIVILSGMTISKAVIVLKL